MIFFASDYIAGAHPQILKRLSETNMDILPGYGTDRYCQIAAEKIKQACECPQAEVFFIAGGTQTNQITIDSMLKPFEGVIAADTGHIGVHEAGAIEYTGHKVIELECENGKLKASTVDSYVSTFYDDDAHEHMVYPGMVYISFPTEYGTIYGKDELAELYGVCRKYGMCLFIDGARLGYGLASKQCDLTMPELARLCDVFYIGGTKVGALCGEALVFTHGNMPEHFVNLVKKHGALLAKGRLLGVQFDALFTDDLYMNISRHAIDLAEKLKTVLRDKGCEFYIDSPTNQQFVILENGRMKELAENVEFGFWEKYDDNHTVVRFATAWSTTEQDIIELQRLM